ncbi:MAG TPA: ABC transporter substrate-binding protein [Candidatus Lachnoclostridium stercorigallinarum]|uniref:ABC transporter substrate-binding protein n=1 Tax=Candidatus Lachnoclostridium stercorigallinarum TaxID=2838634 RepID=A0A9D2K6H6_9FIRM|nr:ABC transporter substrate-binding protein [Candidatus Lachnoclostridium stercorigallinarum]
MKKAISVGLVAAVALSMAACGSSDTAETTAASDTTAAAGSEAEQAESGADDGMEEFIIGSTGPLTGANASYGTSVKQGEEIAIQEINEAGGVQVGDTTYKLVLNFQDDEAKEDKAVTAFNTLVDDGMNAYVGAVTTGACLAQTDLSYEANILQITPSASAEAVTENPNVFRMCFTDPLQGQMIAQYVIDNGYESVAVLWNNADEYSAGIHDAFVETLEAEDAGLLVADESFATGDVDFNTQLTVIKNSGAKLLFVPAYYGDVAYIVQQAKDAGMDCDFVGSDGWDGVLGQVTDPSVVEGAVFLSPFLATEESAADFVSKYEAAYGATPDQFAADGYDCVYAIKAAMEQAGSIETEALIQAMTEITIDGLTGQVSFDESGEPDKTAKFVQILDGEYTAM